jgi:hypothetical protein
MTGKARSAHNTDLLTAGLRRESPFAEPEAERLGYPKRKDPPCMRGTPDQAGCRIACSAPSCVYLSHGNCPWPNWGRLTRDQRDRYNRAWPYDGSKSGTSYLSKRS